MQTLTLLSNYTRNEGNVEMNIDQGIKSFWKIISGIKSFQEDYSNDRLVDTFKRNMYKIQFLFAFTLFHLNYQLGSALFFILTFLVRTLYAIFFDFESGKCFNFLILVVLL